MAHTMTIKTASDLGAEALAARKEAARRECRRRIFAVADETAQMNLTAARAAGLLTSEQQTTHNAGLAWVAAMRAAWEPMAEASEDPLDDANWPAIPAGVAELAALF